MKSGLMAAALGFVFLRPAFPQDAVQLRNGKYLSGKVAIDSQDPDGFTVERWDTGGSVYVRWSQVPTSEKNRILGKPVRSSPDNHLVDAVLIVTSSRILTGVVTREEPAVIFVKTRDAKAPLPVPKVAIQSREPVKVPEADLYIPEERIERRAAAAEEGNYSALVEVGKFAASLKMYEKAKEFYLKAASADTSKKEEIEALMAANEGLIQEERAAKMLAQVRDLVEDTEFAAAIELAKKMLLGFGATEVATQNKDLVAQIQAEAEEHSRQRAEYLARKVPDLWKSARTTMLAKCASSLTLAAARNAAKQIDGEIQANLAKKLKSTVEEVRLAWDKRSPRQSTANYGPGTWIARGGPDGGLDIDTVGPPNLQPQHGQGAVVYQPFQDSSGAWWSLALDAPPPKLKQYGRLLPTREEWWALAPGSARREWLEADYVAGSACVTRLEEIGRKCAVCAGGGEVRTFRGGRGLIVKCPRCHGVKEDVLFRYW